MFHTQIPTDWIAKRIAENNAHFVRLDLSGKSLSSRDLIPIIDALKHNFVVKEVDLSNSTLCTTVLGKLAETLETNTTIEILNLADNFNDVHKNECLSKLAKAIITNTHSKLATLNLSGNVINGHDYDEILSLITNSTLMSIDISNNIYEANIPFSVWDKIADSMQNNFCLLNLKGVGRPEIAPILARNNKLSVLFPFTETDDKLSIVSLRRAWVQARRQVLEMTKMTNVANSLFSLPPELRVHIAEYLTGTEFKVADKLCGEIDTIYAIVKARK